MIELTSDDKLKKLIVVGDRVLIKPKNPSDHTPSGLFLPPTVTEKEQVQQGYIVKVGPGYPLPDPTDEPWKEHSNEPKYLPLQAKEGDIALFLQKSAIEVEYQSEKFLIVPIHAILLLERIEDLF